nr:pyridine nucleotide-disulfide oxidoreductase/dicluster-binding protein [Desulfogranum japonicum]
MDQKQLREFESHCIQEEHPYCTAACPIHVDVRGFMAFMAKGKLKDARKILDRSMPFPEILGRICDHPCEQACIRNQLDESLNIHGLEFHCVSNTSQVLKLPKLPGKGGKVLVFGSGLTAMTAALDLARKGRQSTIISSASELGGSILEIDDTILPLESRETAVQMLERYDVTITLNQKITPERITELTNDCDAVLFDLDTISLDILPADRIEADPISLHIGGKNFAGGGSLTGENFSPIKQVADGRRAALSIERFLQNASLTAQRTGEGATTTRLYTSLEGVAVLPQKTQKEQHLSPEEATEEAGRCIQCECMECVKQCQFLQAYKEYPKTLVRKIFNNESIVQGTRQANTMINSCSLCNQCTVICPNDFPVAEVCRTAREQLVQAKHMPPSAHEFALEDMAFSLSDTCSLLKHQPGTDSSQYLYFPGCQLSGSSPETVIRSYQFLCDHLDGNVGIMLSCCGIPAHWAGQPTQFEQVLTAFTDAVNSMGMPTVITACSSCLSIFKEFTDDISVTSLWEVLDSLENLPASTAELPSTMAVFDPCTAREQKLVRQSVRNLCSKIGIEIDEFPFNAELADCCGYGGLMQFANQNLGERTAKAKGERSPHPGLAYCAMCRDNLVSTGKPIAHLLDFLFPDPDVNSLLERPNPGFSGRHENRARLKQKISESLFQETDFTTAPHSAIELLIEPQVIELMNRRHILEEDVRKVIHHVNQNRSYFINPENNRRLAKYRPIRVTYWVEYSEEDSGYRIHNCYSHRMVLPEDQP